MLWLLRAAGLRDPAAFYAGSVNALRGRGAECRSELRRQIGEYRVPRRPGLEATAAIDDAPDLLIGQVLHLHAQRCGMPNHGETIPCTGVDERLCRVVRTIIEPHGHAPLVRRRHIERATGAPRQPIVERELQEIPWLADRSGSDTLDSACDRDFGRHEDGTGDQR